jgi:hypothetical protein
MVEKAEESTQPRLWFKPDRTAAAKREHSGTSASDDRASHGRLTGLDTTHAPRKNTAPRQDRR